MAWHVHALREVPGNEGWPQSPDHGTGRNDFMPEDPSFPASVRPSRPGLPIMGQVLACLAASVLLVAWSGGLGAIFRDRYHPSIPQWTVVVCFLLIICGVLALVAKGVRTAVGNKILTGLAMCLFVPMIGTIFGGVYYWAAAHVSKGRNPLMHWILAAGLAVTVVGFGIATGMTIAHIALAVGVGMAGLFARVALNRHSSISPVGYGALHFATLLFAMALASIENDQRNQLLSFSNSSRTSFISRSGTISNALANRSITSSVGVISPFSNREM